ncbi:MAG: hypothetical protein A4E57_03180 [Syntrophorhabdaceae bacterium PtaU1.Bin034]|nr:MAG: hypothetical protein A4E57_03180 [Syntrophorhabdaceae bacterium PtaU1.Bin034]
MTPNPASEVSGSGRPTEKHTKSQRIALFFAGVGAAQSFSNLGYLEGMNAVKEGCDLILATVSQRGGRVIKSSEDSVTACFADPAESLKAAIDVQRNAVENKAKHMVLNIRIAIHFGDGLTEEGDLSRDMAAFSSNANTIAKARHIYVSKEVFDDIQGFPGVDFRPVRIPEDLARRGFSFYDVGWQPETDAVPAAAAADTKPGNISSRFLHAAALVEGQYPRCFYCGSRRHATTSCPSKSLFYSSKGLERLGHLSIEEINRLFSKYLSQAGEDLQVLPEPVDGDGQEDLIFLAPLSFYELKIGFQLRFLNIIWNASAKEDWHKARRTRRESSPEGGMLWIARDCLRTSQLERAEELLKQQLRGSSKNYRAYCGLAFVKIEKGNYALAAECLNEALTHETSNLHRTYMLLLLSRVYEFTSERNRADDRLREALRLEPYCPEALFEEIIRCFRRKQEAEGVNRLQKLIHIYREFYAAALISPDLAPYQDTINRELQKIVSQSGDEARKAAEEAEKEIGLLKRFLGEDDEEFAHVLSTYEQLRELVSKPEAFLNNQETVRISKEICASCRTLERERKGRVLNRLGALESRALNAAQRGSRTEKIARLVTPIFESLHEIEESLEAHEPFSRCMTRCKTVSDELDKTELTIKKIEARHALFLFWVRFIKDSLSILLITATVALALLPGIVWSVGALEPGLLSLERSGLWPIQKAFLVVGSVFAVIFAFLHAFVRKARANSGR